MDPDPNPNRENINFCFTFFYIKNRFLQNMIYFVIYEVNIYVSKHKFNSFATRIRIRFIEADQDQADQNETDPNGSGSETLAIRINCFIKYNILVIFVDLCERPMTLADDFLL